MTMTATTSKAHSVGGVSFPENLSFTGDGVIAHDVEVAAAEAGELTTRTNNTDGVITGDDSTTAIVTGNIIDIYWATGSRHNVDTVVSGGLITISGGAGDNLPSQSTDLTFCKVEVFDVQVDGDNINALFLYAGAKGQFTFMDTSNIVANQIVGALGVWDWNENSGVTNPLAGDSVTTVQVSHNSTTAATMRLGLVYANA